VLHWRHGVILATELEIQRLLAAGNGMSKTARIVGTGSGTVRRVRNAGKGRRIAA